MKLFLILLSSIILLATVHGEWGNPTQDDLLQLQWYQGPFELSPERGRYALTYSILENGSFSFSPELAAFAAPDVASLDDTFVSLFPPGLSYLIMPGYQLGKQYNLAQLGSFLSVTFFAIINTVLIFSIAKKVGANTPASAIASVLFLFASPSFMYAVTLYQHHVTTTAMLLSIWLLVKVKNLWSLALVWLLCGFAVVLDYPNFFFFLPIGLFGLRKLVTVEKNSKQYLLSFKFRYLFTFIFLALPIAFFMYFNSNSYGNPLQLGGTVSRAKSIEIVTDAETGLRSVNTSDSEVLLEESSVAKKTAVAFFRTRNVPNGLYTHFFSQDRGMLFFTPILFLSLFAIPSLLKRREKFTVLLLFVIGMIVLLYSLWGDPYGGWAFGSRYLIPVYALLSVFLAVALTQYKNNIFFVLIAIMLSFYSVVINTAGALTSNANPPRVELAALEEQSGIEQQVGFDRNFVQISQNKSKSFFFNNWANQYVTVQNYMISIVTVVSLFLLFQFGYLVLKKDTRVKK